MSSMSSSPSTPRARGPLRTAVTAAALALVAAGVAACSGGSAAEEAPAQGAAPPATVLAASDVAVATAADLTSGILLTGTLEPAERVTVTAQVGGTLGPLRVDRGTTVRRGQRITTIEAAGVRSQAAGARAAVASAEANLVAARTQRDAAQRLHEAGAISRLEAENAQAAYQAAEAQVAAAQAQATAASEQAGFTVVTAPMSGVVSDRPVEAGEAVDGGDPIVTIVNTALLELYGRIPVDEAGAVRVGQPVTFTLDAFPGREFTGTVARKDPTADPATRQVGVYVRLPNPRGEVTAGQFARGRVSGRRVEDAVVVPLTAVEGTGGETAVYVIENGRLARRVVTLGVRDAAAGRVAVSEGLRAGERILARPTPSVADGQAVVLSEEGRGAAGGSPAPAAPAAAAPAPGATPDSGGGE
jgi:RND family efflux transporter MFP subunit